MFEKEAEEYGHEHCCDSCKNLQAKYIKVFEDGAEFGYNKAKEEWNKHFLQCSSPFCLDIFKEMTAKQTNWLRLASC